MRKSTRAALAAGAGVALLLGWSTTLAYWTGTGTVGGGTIDSGHLSLSSADCDPGPGTGSVWTFQDGSTFDPATQKIVPGDAVTKTCSFVVAATGKNLVADLTVSGGTTSGSLAAAVTVTGSYLVDGAAATGVTDDDNGKTLRATVTVDFPYGTSVDNSTQDQTVTVTDYVITLTQADPAP